MSTATLAATDDMTRFDFARRVQDLMDHPTNVLRAMRDDLVHEQRRLHIEELAVTRVLDARNALGAMPTAQVSARTATATIQAARALESLPEVAAAAHAGALSWDQLQPLVEVATPGSDTEWARRGPNLDPAALQRMARRARAVSAADAEARHEAREVRSWTEHNSEMHAGRWRLPDVDGALVDKVLEHMAERMRPAKGKPWDSLAHRKADALIELARNYADVEPTGRFRLEIVNIVDPRAVSTGATIGGIALAAETVAVLMPNAKVRDCVVDDTGCARTITKPRTALPTDVERHIRRRDTTCRIPGCDATRGLQIHHLDLVCTHGDSHDPRALAAVCPHHHHLLEPHGPYRLVGNAEDPDGLQLVHRDELTPSDQHERPPP
jgi:hypothetical protein